MDWEDSRSEFFQETYPCDRSISDSVGASNTSTGRKTGAGTMQGTLESRQNAAAAPASVAVEEEAHQADQLTRHDAARSSGTKPRMRAAVQGLEEQDSDDGDIEVVDFTDENLATEVESWQNRKKLRDMPIPLEQKKALRAQYEKCPKIKLNRMRAIRFALSRFGHAFLMVASSVCTLVTRWNRPLIGVDRRRGPEMFAVLSLQKLMMLLSAMVSLTVLSFLLLPYLVFACNFSLHHCQPLVVDDVSNGTLSNASWWWWRAAILATHQSVEMSGGSSSDKRIPFYYGFLEVNSDLGYNDLSQAFGSHLPLIYVCVSVLCQLGLIAYIGGQLRGLVKRLVCEDSSDSWFKSLYSSWNHNVVCRTSCLLKHRSVYRHLKHKLELSQRFAKTCCTRCLTIAARLLSLVLMLASWVGIVLAIHFSVLVQLQPLAAVEAFMPSEWVAYALPVALLSLTKLVSVPLAGLLEKWERYPFHVRAVIYTVRLFVCRAAALFTLISTVFHVRLRRGYQGACWEDHLCNQMIAVAAADIAIDWALVLLLRFPCVLLASLYKREWSCSTKLNYNPYETTVDLVLDLCLLSAGLLYCPPLPVVMCAKLCVSYPLRMYDIWVNCSASREVHSPTCIRFLFVGFSAVALLFSTLLMAFGMVYNPVSTGCGPFSAIGGHMSEVVKFEWRANLKTSISAYIMASLIVVLLFGLYISHLKRLSAEKSASQLKCQLAIATQEKCYLISKIKRPKPK